MLLVTTRPLRPAIFLDRDGVIIENRADYVRSVAEVQFIPGAVQALAHLAPTPWPIVIITNQSAVGRGLISLTTVEEIHTFLLQHITQAGGRIDGVYVCPHHPEAKCACRKPAPGMLQQAARELSLDLAASVLIGDAVTDVQAAHAAGAQAILVRTGLGASQSTRLAEHHLEQVPILADLPTALEHWLTHV